MLVDVGMHFALDSFGIIILFLILFNFGSGMNTKNSLDNRLFTALIFINIILQFCDFSVQVLNGEQFFGAVAITTTMTAALYLLYPILGLVWLVYCEYKLTEDSARIAKKLPFILIPVILLLIGTGVSIFKPFFFWIDDQNLYHRGPYYHMCAFTCWAYVLYSFIITVSAISRDKSGKQKRDNISLLLYPAFPLVGTVIQIALPGVSTTYIGFVLSLLIIYFNLQNAEITTDVLTSLNNRRRFNAYMEYKLQNKQRASMLFLIMTDIDHFKNINDLYGHIAGDGAIKQVGQILVKSVQKSDFIARIGGDEFAVVGERANEREVMETVEAIRRETILHNESKLTPYKLSLSIGYSLLRKGGSKTMDELMMEADRRMYEEKLFYRRKKPRTFNRSVQASSHQ